MYEYCQRVASLGLNFFAHEVLVVAPSTVSGERLVHAGIWQSRLVSMKHEAVAYQVPGTRYTKVQ